MNADDLKEALEKVAAKGYRFSERYSLSIFGDHASNAGIFARNDGLESFGLRVGYHF